MLELEVVSVAKANREQLQAARIEGAKDLAPESIHMMQADQLFRLQQHFGLGSQWGVIVMPAAWFPPGHMQAEAGRRVDANSLDGSAPDRELARVTLTRYALVLLLCKVASRGFKSRLLASTSIRASLTNLKLIMQSAMERPATEDERLLSRLDAASIGVISQHQGRRGEVRRIHELVARGLWLDAPEKPGLGPVEDSTEATIARASTPRKGAPKAFLPLPDNFVAEAGWRIIWLVETLGASIIECGRELATARPRAADAGGQGAVMVNTRMERASKDVLARHEWIGPDGQAIDRPPFEILATRAGGGKHGPVKFSWPPRTHADYLKLLLLLQDAHLFLFLLATGGRISEAMSLAPGCIVSTTDGGGDVQGRTYKLVFSDQGKEREWPLPELALLAIRQQIQVAEVLNALGARKKTRSRQQAPDAIWVSGNGAKVAELPNKRLRISMRILGVLDLLDAQALTSHRFRKTLARLVALAIVGAPKVLMDLFGHKTIEMTLHYMTADPQLRAEIAEVARAQTIMFAENAIRASETNGGGAGARLRAVMREERVRLGRDFGEDDIRQLAETLTDNGKTWMLVRPGVICTKSVGQSGPCNKSLGRPEPSRCRPSCGHRLEDAILHEDVDGAIAEAVGSLAEAVEKDDYIQAEMWRGQVFTHLNRFEDLRAKWSVHPVVAGLLNGSTATEEVA